MNPKPPRDYAGERDARLTREDRKISRCPRCGAWRYALVCTGACPVLGLVKT
jgi:hypothetical protein